MSTPILTKMHINGYEVLRVNNGPWRVCTKADRLGSFGSRDEAFAYASSLPTRVTPSTRIASTQ